MINVANTIEDLLEILAGIQLAPKMQIDSTDATIMQSIARQVFKGTALTDRQHALMKEKLQTYRDQFIALDYDFDRAVDTLRQPLRYIDRSKYIKIVSHSDVVGPDQVYESYKSTWKWIEVRFPFAKKTIIKINKISNTKDYYHSKGSHKHYFRLTEKNIINVIDELRENNFDIDQQIKDLYDKISSIQNQKHNFIPSIKDLNLVNVDPRAVALAESEIGKLDKNNLIQYIDRRKRYGIVDYDQSTLTGDLAEHIALHSKKDILFKTKEYRIDEVLFALEKLKRYPMIVLLEEHNAEEQLHSVYNFYRDFLPNEQQSVLFRLDSDVNSDFNQLIKDYKLNNWVDKNTKIVYINTNKLPKILFNCDWQPITALSFNSKINRNIDYFISDRCDLIAFYDDELSPIRRYSSYYG